MDTPLFHRSVIANNLLISNSDLAGLIRTAGNEQLYRDYVVAEMGTADLVLSKDHGLLAGLYIRGDASGDFRANSLDMRLDKLIPPDELKAVYEATVEGPMMTFFERAGVDVLSESLTKHAISTLVAQTNAGQRGLFLGGVELRTASKDITDQKMYSALVVPFDFRMAPRTVMEDSSQRGRKDPRYEMPTDHHQFATYDDAMMAAYLLTISAVHNLLAARKAAKD